MNLSHGDLENLVLNVIWNYSNEYNESPDVAIVTDKLNSLNVRKKRAYTTVKTVMDRLAEKGILDKIKSGKKFVYKSIMPRNEMAEKALKKVAMDYFQNDFIKMAKLVSDMAYEEEKNLVHAYN